MLRILTGLAVCVLALAVPGAVHAQRGGGGHGGGGGHAPSGPAHSGSGYGQGGPAFSGPGYHDRNYYNRGYYGRPYGYGDIYLGFSYYPYPYLDTYPSALPGVPDAYLLTPYRRSVEPAPLDIPSAPQPAPIGNVANIRVILPSADAKLLVDDTATTSTGDTRLLETPELKPGKTYHYELTVTWQDGARSITEKRTVEVAAGAVTLVDFTRPAPRPQP